MNVRHIGSWRGTVERYAGAAALTIAGLVVVLLFQHLRGVPDALVFAATVALSARYFGTGPSLLASALSIGAIDLTLLPPLGSIELTHPEELAYIVVFVILVLVISGTTHSLGRALDSSEQIASRSSGLLRVTTALAEAASSADVARVVLSDGLALVEGTSGIVGVLEGRRFRVLDSHQTTATPASIAPHISLDGDGPLSEALRRRAPVWLESRDDFRARFPAAAARVPDGGTRSWVAFPLMHGDEIVGGMVLGFAAPSAIGATDRTFVELLSQSVASALARARTFERERTDRVHAEAMARAREEVLGVVAHDLRNPLGVMGSAIQLLRELELSPEERERCLAAAGRSVQQMNRLINDLLDVVRLEAGHFSVEPETLTASNVLEDALDGVRHLAAERRIRLTLRRPEGPSLIHADRMRLGQALGNLLGNAVKFTPEGGVVELTSFERDHEVVFQVADSGPGVSAEGKAHLFDRFWQERRADKRGVGLGLSIAKGIVEAHHGRIWVESEPGAGSRFFVALPLASADAVIAA